jgi:hypothetical protein
MVERDGAERGEFQDLTQLSAAIIESLLRERGGTTAF